MLDGMLFRGPLLTSLTKPGFTAVDAFVTQYYTSGTYCFFIMDGLMCTAYTNLANTFLISFPSKKQRSIVDD